MIGKVKYFQCVESQSGCRGELSRALALPSRRRAGFQRTAGFQPAKCGQAKTMTVPLALAVAEQLNQNQTS